MSDAVNLIVQAEMSDGLLAVVEDALNKGVYHIYKNDKNVQPNHDALGVMRYLAVIVHAQDYRASNAEKLLNNEREKTTKLEAKVKLLEQLVCSLPKCNPVDEDVCLFTDRGDIKFTNAEQTLYRIHSDEEWIAVKDPKEALNIIYKEIK